MLRGSARLAARVATTDQAAIFALLFNAFVWGVSWLPFRYLESRGLASLWATAFIYGLGFLGLLVWLFARGAAPKAGGVVPAASSSTLPALLGLALASGLTNVCFNWALTVGPVVRVVLLFYLMPIWAVLLARWLLQEPISGAAVLRIGLALLGALVVLWRPDAGWPWPDTLPDWLALAGGACFALTNVLLRKLAGVASSTRAMTMFGGCWITATAVALAVSAGGLTAWPSTLWLSWLPAALVMTVVFMASNLALQFGAARLPANVTAVVMLSEVLFASVSALIFGGEALSLSLVLGGLLIVLAAWLAGKSD